MNDSKMKKLLLGKSVIASDKDLDYLDNKGFENRSIFNPKRVGILDKYIVALVIPTK